MSPSPVPRRTFPRIAPRLFPGCRGLASLLGAGLIAGSAGAGPLPADQNAAESLSLRVTTHGFPSIFEAWSPIENLNQAPGPAIPLSARESRMQSLARHDLVFLSLEQIGLVWNNPRNPGLSTGFTAESVRKARVFKARLLALNPHAVLLAEIRYHDATSGYFPDDSPWWLRDQAGQRVRKTHGTSLHGFFLLDTARPDFQDQIARLCAAVVDTGALDGCMLDWWNQDLPERASLARRIRYRIGDRGLLLVNVNGSVPSRSAPYVNGIFMEGFGAPFFPDWRTAAKNLQWAASHLRAPAFTAFETWYPRDAPASGTTRRNDLARLRFATTLSLCNSDGYVLYADPFPTPGHPHDWYDFWRPSLGPPIEAAGRVNPDGSLGRNFQNGSAVCNPPENPAVSLIFPTPVRRQSTHEVGTRFSVAPGDGEIFVRP